MNCPKCGKHQPDTHKFCIKCGTKLEQGQEQERSRFGAKWVIIWVILAAAIVFSCIELVPPLLTATSDYVNLKNCVYILDNGNGLVSKQTYFYDGDMVCVVYDSMSINKRWLLEDEIEACREHFDSLAKKAENIDCVELTINETDDHINVLIFLRNLDEPENIRELIRCGIIEADNRMADYISLEQTRTILIEKGYIEQ